MENIFEENKHKIKLRYSRSQKESQTKSQKEEFDQMVIGKFKKAIMSYHEEGFLVGDIVEFLNSIKEIVLFDQGKFSNSERAPFIGAYGSVDNNFYLRINSDSQDQFVSTVVHELRHFQQFRSQDFWNKEYLDQCHGAVRNLRDKAQDCIFSSLEYSECEKVFQYAKENKHRPILIETPYHKKLESEFAEKNGFRINIVENKDGSEKVVLAGIQKDGKIVKPLKEEKELYELLRNMDLNLRKYDIGLGKSYKEMPTDKDATYDSFLGFFGKDFRAKFEEYFRAFVELGPHLLASLPREALFDLCGKPKMETSKERLDEYGKTDLLSKSAKAFGAKSLGKKGQRQEL